MKNSVVSVPELALIAGTRALLGAGLGLLLAERFSDSTRRVVGRTLFGIGLLSTIPLAFEVLNGQRLPTAQDSTETKDDADERVRESEKEETHLH